MCSFYGEKGQLIGSPLRILFFIVNSSRDDKLSERVKKSRKKKKTDPTGD